MSQITYAIYLRYTMPKPNAMRYATAKEKESRSNKN